MKETENSKIGLIGTIFFHALLCVFLYFSTFKAPNPLPEEEGILVNFGDLNNGMQQQQRQRGHKAPKQIVQANITIDKKNISSKDRIEVSSKDLLTQDTEEAPSIVDAKKKGDKDKTKDQATKKWLEKLEKNNKKLEEDKKSEKLNKEKEDELKHKLKKNLEAKLKLKEKEQKEILEKERIRKAEIEKKKKEEKEKIRKQEEKKKKLEEIDSKVKNAFAKKNTNNNTSKDQGEGTGNLKGFPKGGLNGQGTNNSSIGTGLGSKGISFSLKGRKSSSVPKPSYNLQESGRVIVEITVNKQGIVTNARAGMPGSTTTSPQLYQAAKKAALKARFNADPSAPEYQTGRISYTFFLN